MAEPLLTIKTVARQTGLSAHVIRAWEKRYGAVRPERSGTRRRVYTSRDVDRLKLLRAATNAGHSIGQVARLRDAQLAKLASDAVHVVPSRNGEGADAAQFIETALTHAANLDSTALHAVLERGAIEFGSPGVLHKVIAPIAERVGDTWRAGEFSVRQERFATSTLMTFLNQFARPYGEPPGAPHMIITTPSGQLHEIGAMLAAAAARTHGWKTTYLGPSLPVEELIGAVQQLHPRAVGLSVVYPPNDADVRRDLGRLVKLLPHGCTLLIGGRSAADYADTLRGERAKIVGTLEELYPLLDSLGARKRAKL